MRQVRRREVLQYLSNHLTQNLICELSESNGGLISACTGQVDGTVHHVELRSGLPIDVRNRTNGFKEKEIKISRWFIRLTFKK